MGEFVIVEIMCVFVDVWVVGVLVIGLIGGCVGCYGGGGLFVVCCLVFVVLE